MANHTILLIDYEPRSVERFRDPLVAAGYAVELATDGISGVEAFHRLNPDMVLVEAMIPKKHGFEVCQELKRTPHGRRTPIIITTGVYKGRKYRTQALHHYGCDEYIEKPIAPAQLLEIVGRFLAPGVPGIPAASTEAAARPPASAQSGDRPIARQNVDAVAKPAPSAVKDDREDEITARLDALLSGKGSESPLFAAPEKAVAAAAVAQDPFMQMRAELDAELGAISSPMAFETAPFLEPIVEPLVSDQMEAPSVLETLSVPAMEPPIALAPVPEMPAAPASSDEQPGQLVNFETKRRRKGKKTEKQVAKSAPKIDEVAQIAPLPEAVEAVIPSEVVAPVAVKPPIHFPEITLPRGTMVESELEATPKRRGMPLWAWSAVAVVAVVGLYFVFPYGGSTPSSPAPSPAPPAKTVASTPPAATPMPVATPPPVVNAPSAALPKAPEPSRAVPDSPKPIVVAAKVPVPKKRSDPVPAPAVVAPTATELAQSEPAAPEPVTIKAAAPSAPETTVTGVETVPDPSAAPAVTKIAPGALVPIDVADTMPVSLKRKAPVYSAAAKQLGLSGTVTMNVLINDRGTVDQVVLVSGIPGADLNDTAIAAAKAWTYRPATKNGVPVKVWRSEQVVFKP